MAKTSSERLLNAIQARKKHYRKKRAALGFEPRPPKADKTPRKPRHELFGLTLALDHLAIGQSVLWPLSIGGKGIHATAARLGIKVSQKRENAKVVRIERVA